MESTSMQTGLRRRATISDVAAAAGVSKATVSQVLSGRRPVSATTRRRVEEVIKDLDYRPSPNAQSLTTSSSKTIALIVPDITNPFYAVVARGMQEAVIRAGYLAFVADSGEQPERERSLLRNALDRQMDGLAIAAFAVSRADIEQITALGLPVVGLSPGLAETGPDGATEAHIDTVGTDDHRMGVDAARHLLGKSHRDIAIITGTLGSSTGRLRFEGFRSALEQSDLELPPRRIAKGEWTRDSGYSAMQALLRDAPPPTAVFCSNDLMAIGAIDAVRDAGLTVPGDVAIMGVDDIEAASLVTPRLTTVSTPGFEIGRTAGELLLTRIAEGADRPPQRVALQHRIIERNST